MRATWSIDLMIVVALIVLASTVQIMKFRLLLPPPQMQIFPVSITKNLHSVFCLVTQTKCHTLAEEEDYFN
jgi:hypothetical protein